MRRSALALVLACALTGCTASSENAGADPTVTMAPGGESVMTQDVTIGGATVTGPLGAEPAVTIDTAAGAATELLIADAAEGTGQEVQDGDTVTAHYAGYGGATGQLFDASWQRGAPATFPLARVIAGWQQGLVGMKVGGRRVLVIPADLGYGQSPPPGSGIQPGETLVFVVDLVSIG